jgi:hypothetical protein
VKRINIVLKAMAVGALVENAEQPETKIKLDCR